MIRVAEDRDAADEAPYILEDCGPAMLDLDRAMLGYHRLQIGDISMQSRKVDREHCVQET